MWGKFALRRGEARYPTLWDGRVAAWCPSVTGPTGTRLYDLQDGRYVGALTLRSADVGWNRTQGLPALLFSGSSTSETTSTQGRVVISTDLGASVAISFSAWITPTTLSKRGICTSGPTQTLPRFALTILATGQIQCYRGANADSAGTISSGVTSHIVVVNDGTNTSCWLNGKLSNTISQGISHSTQTEFFVGSNYWGAFDGSIDDVAIYNRVLTAGEIRTLSRRRGIAYEPRRQQDYGSSGFQAAWARSQRQIIGGGV